TRSVGMICGLLKTSRHTRRLNKATQKLQQKPLKIHNGKPALSIVQETTKQRLNIFPKVTAHKLFTIAVTLWQRRASYRKHLVVMMKHLNVSRNFPKPLPIANW